MKAIWNNQVIAESDETIVIERNHYFPLTSVNKVNLKANSHTTDCPWKGTAHYYDVVVDNEVNQNAAWYYQAPKDGANEKVGKDFTNHIAFWNGVIVE